VIQMIYGIFVQKIVIASITCTILNHYYMHYLSKKSKIPELRAKSLKLKAKTELKTEN